MEAFERLVTLEDFSGKIDEDDEGIQELPVEGMVDLSVVDVSRFQEPPNFGSRLLSLHVTSILGYLQAEVTRSSKGFKKGLSTRDLTVMMRLAEFISDADQSKQLVDIIIPAINAGYDVRSSDSWGEAKGGAKRLTEEQTEYLLSTLALLMKNVGDSKVYFTVLLPLLGKISSRTCRSSLCNVFAAIGQKDADALKLSNQIAALNSFDPRRMDEPDFSRRLDAYKEINAELTHGTASTNMVRMVVYNSSFSLRVDDDMSLRDSASFSLQSVATYLLKIDENEAKAIIASHLIPQVRQLIRSKKEQVRHEAVTILAVLVQKCSELHLQLKDLSKLTDPDPEMDFFENMRHLQGHRRARALVKVAAKLKEAPRLLHADTLTQYLMPLASVYLFSDVYVKQSHLVDAAIEVMNAIAKNLPWFSYDKILRYYLQQLVKRAEYQKQAVRIVVAILDGFHFDLSKSKAAVRVAVDQPAVETEQEAQPEELEDLEEVVEQKEEVHDPKEESTSGDILTHIVVPAETTSSKIHDTIMRTILPQLHRLLTARSKRDSQHKVNRGQDYYPEDEEILRVPLALAMVALLKGLPRGTLERNLPGIFMKICTFLKSRADSIRETARDTVVKIMIFLGPAHLYTLVRESSAILKRGFQVHVLIYTLHAVLHNILSQVKVGDLDGVLPRLVELCIQELFGDTSEEKEVAQIVAKVKEAKGHKSYDLLNMMAKFVSQKRLMPLVTPFKDVLITTKSHKVIRKIEDCYYHIATGLAANESITLQSELIFIHGIVTESIPQWFPKEAEAKEVKPVVEKPDSFLIQPEPKRKSAAVTGKENAKTGMKTHSHIMIEFALQLLHLRLKKETIEAEEKTLLGMLDPFVSILADSLASPHNKQIGLALRCLTKLLCLPLPSIEKNIKRICGSVFTVLNKYSGPGSAQGDQYEMVVSAYKLITVIIRDVSSMKLENDQLRVLLTYAEQSLSDVDGNSQATGFAVLKAILGRRLEFPELSDVMQRIAKLAIISEISHVRSQCRQLFLQYLVDYPLGKKVIRQIQFFLGQLEYDREDGRLSALEFLDSVFGTFPKPFLNANAPLLFVTLSPRFVNEDSKICLKMVAGVLRKLLSNLEDSMRNELFQIVLLWLQDDNVSHRIISAQLAEIFVEVEGTRFESRLKEILPLLETNLGGTDGDMQKEKLLIRLLITISKIFTTSPVIIRSSVSVAVWREIQKHLLHKQITIRLLCSRLIGLLFAAFTPDEIAKYVNTKRKPKNMDVFENPVEVLRTLALDCSDQLSPLNVETEIAEQAIKNLLFLFKIATRTESGNENAQVNENDESLDHKKLFGVRWYMKRIRKEINSEIAENPNCGVKRTAAFQFYAAALLDLHQTAGATSVIEHLPTLLPPIIREISISEDKPIPELSELATLARETAEFLKQLVGHEVYMEHLAACRKTMNKKKIVRKAEKSQRAVTNPGLAAKLKMKKQASKRDAKKKKIAALKGKVVKKKKLKNVAVLDE